MSQPRRHADDPTDHAISEQAAQWIVRTSDDDESERLRARTAFEAWKCADPRHAAAAASMEQLLGQMQAVREQTGDTRPARAALTAAFARKRANQRVRHIGGMLMVAFLLLAPASVALRLWPPAYLLADMRSPAGQWETHDLPDGTRVSLGSATAVNLRYDAHRRAIELVQGEIWVDVARDTARPFLVETEQGSIRALGTRFVVTRQADTTLLSMIESRVAVQSASQQAAGNGDATVIGAGQRVRITRHTVSPPEPIDADGIDRNWQTHRLVANDQPLADVLDELSRHRPGRILYDRAQIEGIRVSAVLPLDDSEQAMRLLLTNFPALRIRTVTPWLVLVDAPSTP